MGRDYTIRIRDTDDPNSQQTSGEFTITLNLETGREPRLSRVSEVACALAAEHRDIAHNFKIESRRSDRPFSPTPTASLTTTCGS